jgi:hypothetical protein
VRYFPPEVGVASLVRGVVCRYEPNLWVILMGRQYIGEFFNREPLPVALSWVAGACLSPLLASDS